MIARQERLALPEDVDQGVAHEMVDYALQHIEAGTLLERLIDEEQIEIRSGTIHDIDALLATGPTAR